MRSCSIVSSSLMPASHHCCRKLGKFTPSLTWANEKLSWVAEDIITLRLWIILLRAKAKIFSRKAHKFSTNLHFNIQLEMIFHRAESWESRVVLRRKKHFPSFPLAFLYFFLRRNLEKKVFFIDSTAERREKPNERKSMKVFLCHISVVPPTERVRCQV